MNFMYGRLASKQILSVLKGFPSALAAGNHVQAGNYKVNRITYSKPEPVDHDDKNSGLNRPLSPHLSIYAPQITTTLSITHRITGMVLASYVTALGLGALILPGDIDQYVTMIESLQLSSGTLFAAKFILAAPFGYHMANGIRHLNWDVGRSVTNKGVVMTGYIMLVGSVLITAKLASL